MEYEIEIDLVLNMKIDKAAACSRFVRMYGFFFNNKGYEY